MKVIPRAKAGFHVAEVVYSLLVILWYLLPYISPELGSFAPRTLANTLYGSPPSQPGAWAVVNVLSYLLPLICLWKIVSVFLAQLLPVVCDPERPLPILMNFVSSGIVVAFLIMHLVSVATNASYFAAFSLFTYPIAGVSLAYNGYFIVMFIMSWSRRDETFQEYLEFRRSGDGQSRSVFSSVQKQGIQRKLILTFVPLILIIILVLAFLLLRDFSRTILAAVNANGEGLAERTASVVKANPTDKDRINLDDYFIAEAKKNEAKASQSSSFRFNTLSYFRNDPKAANFVVWESTNRKVIGKRAPQMATALTQTMSRYNAGAKSYEFLAPVLLSNTLIGYVMVDYARDVIYEPYFRTQVKVFVIAALFMYASVFLIYLLGRAIVFPILYLRMSVNSISNVLSSMVKGKLRFSSELLQYKDRVRTHDEIKLLSGEVKNMTTVIRG